MEKIYLQNSQDIEETLKHIGFDSIEQAEKICGRSIYALDLDYYDGEITNVKAVHNYGEVSSSNTTQLTNIDSGRLTDDMITNIEYMRSHDSQILYMFCVDYYSGQFSRGHKMLCRLQKRLKRLIGERSYNKIFNTPELYNALRETFEYKELKKQYSNKI